MKKIVCAGMFALLIHSPVTGQEHQHDQTKLEKEAPAQKETVPAKTDGMKCCESMEKTGEMKDNMPKKTEMKAKMEKMKAMKEKMTEKMKAKSMEGAKTKDTKSEDKNSTPNKEEHQH